MKFVHAADLHVDSPLRGLERYEGAPVAKVRGATRAALENLVGLCISESAAFLLLAGDVFDGAWKDYSTGLFFTSQMARLREAKIPVVLVRGNHDAASAVLRALRQPDNVHELSSRKPESVDLGVAVIHGQSFSQRITSEDLASRYPDRVAGRFNIGLLHTSVDGREGHEPYAPTSIATMRSKGYDYWALGHVHAREVLSTDPWIVFPGNLQGRHARETGAKGATLVTVDDGVVTSVEHRALDVVRWEVAQVDASSANDALEVVDAARSALLAKAQEAEGRLLAVRIVVSGATRAHASLQRDPERFVAELRAAANDALGDGVFVEKIKIATHGLVSIERLREEAGAVGFLARRLAEIKADPEALAGLTSVFADLEKHLPADLRDGGLGDASLVLRDPEAMRALVEDVEQRLLPRLAERNEG